jgi:hybrid polyketide synthase/nonribosomal peptide synthetase ACE1
MVRLVLFSHAVQAAINGEGVFDVPIEVGPLIVLKGLVLQISQESQKEVAPYTRLLHRGVNDIKALYSALGYL